MASADAAANESKRPQLESQDELLRALGSNLIVWLDNERKVRPKITPDMVGKQFLVVFHYEEPSDEDEVDEVDEVEADEEEVQQEEEEVQGRKRKAVGESCLGAPYTWTARIGMLRELSANVNTNHLELHFWYEDRSVFPGDIYDAPDLARRIVVPDLSYQLYEKPALTSTLPPAPVVPPEFHDELVAAGHTLLAPFSDYAAVQRHLNVAAVGFDFVVVHKHYSGWAAYKARLVDVDDCLGTFPLFLFVYHNDGGGPLFVTQESQLPDSQLPDMRLGPSLTHFLYSV